MRSMMKRSRGSLFVLAILIAGQSCDRSSPTETARARSLGVPRASFSSSVGSYQIPVPPETNPVNHGGAVLQSSTGITIPALTAYIVTVNGRVNVAKNPADTCYGNTFPDDGNSYGPFGTGVSNWELLVGVALHDHYYNSTVGLGFINPSYGTSGPTQASTDTSFAWHDTDVLVSRNGIGGSCENTGLYLLSGSQTLTVQEISDDVLQLQAPAYVHPPGTQVTFTPHLASGQQITATLSWAWTPDAAPDSTKACPSGWQTCPTKVWKSGTMRVVGNILGRMREGKAHVTVYTSFTLDASATSVHVNDTVTFTPKLDGVVATAARWKWRPDDAGVHDSTACASANSCQKKMLSSGTMWAYLSATAGQGDSASAHVTVTVPCPTGDSLRDSPNIRQKTVELMNASNPDSTPGAGRVASDSSKGWKKERAAWVLQDETTGQYSTQDMDSTTYFSDECHMSFPSTPTPPPGKRYVGIIHTHPASFKNHEAVYGSCPDGNGNRIQLYKNQPGRKTGHIGSDYANGGGSDADWIMTTPAYGFDMLVANKDGELWKLPAYTDPGDRKKNRDQRMTKWKGNSNPACNW